MCVTGTLLLKLKNNARVLVGLNLNIKSKKWPLESIQIPFKISLEIKWGIKSEYVLKPNNTKNPGSQQKASFNSFALRHICVSYILSCPCWTFHVTWWPWKTRCNFGIIPDENLWLHKHIISKPTSFPSHKMLHCSVLLQGPLSAKAALLQHNE